MTAIPIRRAAPLGAAEGTPESFWTSLRYFNIYRIAAATVFAGATTVVFDDGLVLGSHWLQLYRYVSAAYLIAGIAFHVVLGNLRERFNAQLTAHVCTDVAAITLLMHASSGMRSGLGVMLLISLIGAALVAPRRLAYLYAALATIGLLLEQSYWLLVRDASGADYLPAAMLSIGCFAGAGVTNWLAGRVAANEALARRRGQALEMQTRVNQIVIEDLHDGILVLDRDGRVLQHNPHAQRLLGVGQLLGADIDRVLPGLGARWNEWRLKQDAGVPVEMELEVGSKGIRARLVDTEATEDFGVLFLEDITRLRDQAQQLKLAALGRLTANIAHEIRNPLSAISHAAELLQEERREGDRQRLTRIIHDNTRRLDGMVADVLQLSRRDRIAATSISLRTWLRAFLDEFVANEAVPADRIDLTDEHEIDANVLFDREHLRQVLWNLLRNAVRYAPAVPHGVWVAVRVFAGRVELSVVDTGPGVHESIQGQLFEPFFTTDSKGTGLGLYLARELCVANRATLEYVGGGLGGHFKIIGREAVKP